MLAVSTKTAQSATLVAPLGSPPRRSIMTVPSAKHTLVTSSPLWGGGHCKSGFRPVPSAVSAVLQPDRMHVDDARIAVVPAAAPLTD
jgi:hypothetical protein